MRIRDVLNGKAISEVVTVPPDATVRELLGVLEQHNIGAIVVSTDGSEMTGIVSERDVVRGLRDDEALLTRPVSTIMTAVVQTCTGEDTVDALMQIMTEHRVRHVPVLAAGRLAGIISIGDVVKNRIGELEFERDQLDQYVHQT